MARRAKTDRRLGGEGLSSQHVSQRMRGASAARMSRAPERVAGTTQGGRGEATSRRAGVICDDVQVPKESLPYRSALPVHGVLRPTHPAERRAVMAARGESAMKSILLMLLSGALLSGALLSGALLSGALLVPRVASAQSLQITNPLILERADPSIYRHTDGYYYFTATVPAYDLIELRRAQSIQGLSTAVPSVIWRAHASGAMASHIWAPEIHHVDGSWYIYFAAGSSSNVWDIRVYVLSNDSANPLEGVWQEQGQLMTNGPGSSGSFFALDATTFEHQGVRYLVWAESDPSLDVNTVLYIAPMSNPWTLAQRGVRISAPEYDWERVGYAVNEGPAVLKRNGKVFVTYSASATDANYCMGLLTADDTSDLLDPSSWTKSQVPVFRSANGVYGPGHNQFTTTPDGSVDLLVYHGRDYERIEGDPLNDPNRATRVQPIVWNDDGTPNLGSPMADGTLTIDVDPTGEGAAGAAGAFDGGGGVGLGGAVPNSSGGGGGQSGGRSGTTLGGSGGAGGEGGRGNTGGGGGSGGAASVGGASAGGDGSGSTAAAAGGSGGGANVGGATPGFVATGGTAIGAGGLGGASGVGGVQGDPDAGGGVAVASGGAAPEGAGVGGTLEGTADPSGGFPPASSGGTDGLGGSGAVPCAGGSRACGLGTGGSSTSPTGSDASDTGCGCTLPGSPSRRGASVLAFLAVGLGLRRYSPERYRNGRRAH